MQFEITDKSDTGEVLFHGVATQAEANFLFNVGINWLLQKGSMIELSGELEDETIVADEPEQMQ